MAIISIENDKKEISGWRFRFPYGLLVGNNKIEKVA